MARLAVFTAVVFVLAAGVARADEAGCKAMAGKTLPASLIALPTTGAKVTSAAMRPAREGGTAYCTLLGDIAPVDPAAPMIKFQLNLPNGWNEKVLQQGGGGLNGNVVSGEGRLRDAPPGPTPLDQGYATFGTDSGHQTRSNDVGEGSGGGDDPRAFAVNAEATANYAYAAYKKAHDAALALTKLYYGKAPRRVYYFGGSQGGREAMNAIQRFPADYDGAVSTVPTLSWLGSMLASYRHWQIERNGGWMDASKVKLVEKSALDACDAQDGLTDGVIADYRGCTYAKTVKTLQALRCPEGRDEVGCLSDPQIELVRLTRSSSPYGYAIANGESRYTPFATGAESSGGGFVPNMVSGKKADMDALRGYGVGNIRYFIVGDHDFSGVFDPARYKAKMIAVSKDFDMTDPNLAAFKARGGKLIMKSNAADYVVSPASVWRYYENVVKTVGKAEADRFARLYVAPYAGHGGSGSSGTTGAALPDKVDLLGQLNAWVETGKPPPDHLVLTSYSRDNKPQASWPMCRYPNYPRYKGKGDPKAADSYACAAP